MRNILFVVSMFVICISLLLLWACHGGEGNDVQTEGASELRKVMALSDIVPMDDPANPYINDYEAWDFWAYENMVLYQEQQDEEIIHNYYLNREDGETVGYRFIDSQGCLVPYLELVRMNEAAKDTGDKEGFYARPGVVCFGLMPDAVKASMCSAAEKIRAAHYLPVPEWLADSPPVAAYLMPNGDVITEGPLGSGNLQDISVKYSGGCCSVDHQETVTYFRYNCDGELLRTTNSSLFISLYWEDGKEWPAAGLIEEREDFYCIFRDANTNEVLAVYDFDGTPIEGATEPARRSGYRNCRLNAAKIVRVYELQQQISH